MPGHPHPARRAPLGGVALLLGLGTGTAVLATLTVLVRDAAPHAGAGAAAAALFALAAALGAWGAARGADDVARPARRAAWLLVLLAVVAALATRSVTWLAGVLPPTKLAASLGCALPALAVLGLVTGALLALLACHGVRDLERASRPGVTVLAGVLAGLALAAPISSWLTSGLAASWVELLPGAPLLLAAGLAARAGRGPIAELAAPAGVPGRQGEGRGLAWPVLVASVLAGPLAVALDRLLEPAMDAGVHARDALLGSAALAAVIGLAIGSVAARLRERPAGLTPWGFALAAAAALFVLVSDEHRAERLLAIAPGEGSALRLWWTALVAVGPPAALLAASLPPALKVRCDWTGRPGQATGRLVARAAAGFAVGAVAGGWLVVPRLGAAPTVVAVAGLLLAVAVAMRLRTPGTWRIAEALLFLAGLGGLAWPGVWQELTEAAPRASTLWLVRDRGHAPLPVLPEPADVHLVAELLGLEETEPRLPGRVERIEGLRVPGSGRLVLADGLMIAGQEPVNDTLASPNACEDLLQALAGGPGAVPDRVLVVGYGTGELVRALASSKCRDIVATDAEPAWLAWVATGQEGQLPDAVHTLAPRSPRGALRGAQDLLDGPCDLVLVAAAPLARGGHADVVSPASFAELHAALRPGGEAVVAFDVGDLDAEDLEAIVAAFSLQFEGARLWVVEGCAALDGYRHPAPSRADPDGTRVEAVPTRKWSAGAWLGGRWALVPLPLDETDPVAQTHVAARAGQVAWNLGSNRLARHVTTAHAWVLDRLDEHLAAASPTYEEELLPYGEMAETLWAANELLRRGQPAEALQRAIPDHDAVRLDPRLAGIRLAILGALPPSDAHQDLIRRIHAQLLPEAKEQLEAARVMGRHGAAAEAVQWLRAHIDALQSSRLRVEGPLLHARLAQLQFTAKGRSAENDAEAYTLLVGDPATYDDPELFALMLDVRPADATEGPSPAEGRRALATLQRRTSRKLMDAARSEWRAGPIDAAVQAARRATQAAPDYAPAFELFAFLAGCRDAADPAVAEALAHVPDRDRALRIASWFGQTPAPLETETK